MTLHLARKELKELRPPAPAEYQSFLLHVEQGVPNNVQQPPPIRVQRGDIVVYRDGQLVIHDSLVAA